MGSNLRNSDKASVCRKSCNKPGSVVRMNTSKSSIGTRIRDTSSNCNITTPDKPFGSANHNKSGSSNKKSSIKRFKPSSIHPSKVPKPIRFDSSKRKPKVQSRNCKMEYKCPTKLDFGSHNSSLNILTSTRSRQSLNPSTATYKHISQVLSGSANKENSINRALNQGTRSGLKLKISKSKIYTTMDSQTGLSRNKSILSSKSRDGSTQKMSG